MYQAPEGKIQKNNLAQKEELFQKVQEAENLSRKGIRNCDFCGSASSIFFVAIATWLRTVNTEMSRSLATSLYFSVYST